MDNLLDIYTKLKLRIGCDIIVTYYRFGKKYNNTITLLDICEFVYLLGSTKYNDLLNIDFFGSDTIIESIKVFGSSLPIYYNPYASEDIFNGFSIDNNCIQEIRRKMLGDEFINSNYEVVSKYIARDTLVEKYIARDSNIHYNDLFFSEKQKDEFELFFDMLIQELSRYAKKKGLDGNLKFICAGTTSLIYEIGDKIIKIGKPRRCNYIPYCEYLLQPIINRDFSFDGYPIHVEVTQKVLVLENIDGCAIHSDDERFNDIVAELSKILYSRGLSMKDLHPGNVGILLEDNKIHFDEINFDTGCEVTTSIESNNNLNILRKGRFVIIDLDCLKIDDIIKYTEYLKYLGYDEEKLSNLIHHTKCMVKR